MKTHLLQGLRIICIIIFLAVMFCTLTNPSYVLATGKEQGIGDFIDDQSDELESNTEEALNKVSDSIIGVARVISYTIAIVTLMVLGMKYMLSAPGDRADIKKHAVIYVLGAFILFALPSIIEILIKLADTFSD